MYVYEKGLFGGGSTPSNPTPAPKPVVEMPDTSSAQAEEARRREMLRAKSRSGRASTMLSGELDYSNEKLG